jgi:archaellum biogenesis protein FlaJ (TadC family)
MDDNTIWFMGTTTVTLLLVLTIIYSSTDFKFELSLIFALAWSFQNVLVFILRMVLPTEEDLKIKEVRNSEDLE